MLLVLDNYDSFTYNLVHYLRELGQTVAIYPNNRISIEEITAKRPSHIIISPGPGRPEDAGISVPLVRAFCDKIPILGVCLGHQAIAAAFGTRIVNATRILHGKTSLIYHREQSIFSGIAMPFKAMRYHSLIVDAETLPADFMITAWTNDLPEKTEIMAIQHQYYPLAGVQFHPESIGTEAGHQLLQNFLQYSLP